MRALATRLEVVPAALYRHVRNKEQLYDLVLDGVLAEVDDHLDQTLAWTEQIKILAHRLRTVLDNHPGIAALLKTRDPLGPHSLALAEAFLAPLHAGGLPPRETGLAFSLLYDYTVGFALSGPTPSTSNAAGTPRPGPDSTRSSARCRPTASRHWSPSGHTSGSTTATNGSPPASTPSSTDSNAAPPPTAQLQPKR